MIRPNNRHFPKLRPMALALGLAASLTFSGLVLADTPRAEAKTPAAATVAPVAPVAPLVASEALLATEDPLTEKRLQKLSEELRCLVCQNQTIADSHADLAQDLRREIRGMIQAGQSDQQIVDFMVARYGDFVLYRPPVKGITLLLWGGPALLALIGLAALIQVLRRRQQVAPVSLSPEERARAEALLAADPATPSTPNTPASGN